MDILWIRYGIDMDVLWFCYGCFYGFDTWLEDSYGFVMVGNWTWYGPGLGVEKVRAACKGHRVPTLDSLRCQFCCLTQKLNLSIRREIADWAADHNPRSSQTSYLAIRTIYRKCMFGNSAKKIINLIITVFTSFSKQIHNKIVKINIF